MRCMRWVGSTGGTCRLGFATFDPLRSWQVKEDMIDTLLAAEFIGEAQGGATVPLKMACRTANGARLEVYAKCTSNMCGKEGLARDLIGCLLAKKLGIKVGEPVLVEVPNDLIEVIRQCSRGAALRISNSVNPLFGSVALGAGFTLCRSIPPESTNLAQGAAEVWAFDHLFLNVDRNDIKPNCLVNGEQLAIIDHEKALNVNWIGKIFPPPWRGDWCADSNHLFRHWRPCNNRNLDRLRGVLAALGPKDVDDILEQVPRSWADEIFLSGIRGYLLELSANLDAVFRNLEKVDG